MITAGFEAHEKGYIGTCKRLVLPSFILDISDLNHEYVKH